MITNFPRVLSCLAMFAAAALLGCEHIPQDEFMSRDGISPDPTAIIEGTIVYNGPPPTCSYENGQRKRVIGNVVLLMYSADNGPFPEGAATSAINQMVVIGDRLFAVTDCLPEGATPDANTPPISRSTSFTWSRLTLSPDNPSNVQIRAFYDYGEDFNPLFSVLRGPTAGDVLGSARNDVTDESKGLAIISLPKTFDVPNGVVLKGTTVLIDRPVVTERPAFRLGDERRLSADAPFIPAPTPVASLRGFRALTCADPRGDGVNCGLSVSLLPRSDAAKLQASKVRLAQSDSRAYALYVDRVDLTTVRSDDIDRPGPDGRIDPHPVLGPTLGVDWYAPMVVFTRSRTPEEDAVGIPAVRFVGSLLLDEEPPAIGASLGTGPVSVVVPPMAFVEWASGTTSCRVPYVAPRTPAAVTAGRVAHCGELPTGAYAVTLVSGSVRGLPGSSPAVRPSYQQWSVPNELGDVKQVGGPQQDATRIIASQSIDGMFQVSDPPGDPSRASCEAQQGGVCSGSTLPVIEPEPGKGIDAATCLPKACCGAIQHLCGLPLCARVPLTAEVSGPARIGSPATVSAPGPNGERPAPDCVPFEMPRQCCSATR